MLYAITMMNVLLALSDMGSWGLKRWLITILIVVAACMVFWVIVTKGMGWVPPPWFMQVVWIVVALLVGIIAISIIFSLDF